MSEYISDAPQAMACYTHIIGALYTLNVQLTHAWGITETSCKCLTQDPGKLKYACSLHDVPQICTELAHNVFDVLLTHAKLICNV